MQKIKRSAHYFGYFLWQNYIYASCVYVSCYGFHLQHIIFSGLSIWFFLIAPMVFVLDIVWSVMLNTIMIVVHIRVLLSFYHVFCFEP